MHTIDSIARRPLLRALLLFSWLLLPLGPAWSEEPQQQADSTAVVESPAENATATSEAPAATTPAAERPATPPPPSDRVPRIGPAGREAVLAYRLRNYVGPDVKIGDGYVDGGHAMHIHSDNRVTSHREILCVDRTRDAALRREIEYARSDEVQQLNPLDRATRLARRVAMLHTPEAGPEHIERQCQQGLAAHRNREVLLGDLPAITGGAGVCRHRSLLFKILADEAGLRVSLVRGRIGLDAASAGYHAWNELFLDDGSVLIVDVTIPLPDFHFPDTSSRRATHYFTAARTPQYPQPEPQPAPEAAPPVLVPSEP